VEENSAEQPRHVRQHGRRESDQLAYAERPAVVSAPRSSRAASILLSGRAATGGRYGGLTSAKLWTLDQVEMDRAEGHTLTYCCGRPVAVSPDSASCSSTTARGIGTGHARVVGRGSVASSRPPTYGLQWCSTTFQVPAIVLGAGHDATIYVIPSLDLVVVATAPMPRRTPVDPALRSLRAMASSPARARSPRPVGRQRIPHADRQVDQRDPPDAHPKPPSHNPQPKASRAGALRSPCDAVSGGPRSGQQRRPDRRLGESSHAPGEPTSSSVAQRPKRRRELRRRRASAITSTRAEWYRCSVPRDDLAPTTATR
jgi:hypothetical protein